MIRISHGFPYHDFVLPEVDAVRPALDVLVFAAAGADGFEGGAEFEGAYGGGGQQGGEDEVGAGRDNDGLEFLGVEAAGEVVACPAGAENDDAFAVWQTKRRMLVGFGL